MAVLPFSTATLGGTSIAASEFVHGSGVLTFAGTDTATTTADGAVHNIRQSIVRSATCELYGDRSSLNTAVGLSATQIVGPTTFTGVVTATYNHSTHTTRIDIKGDPATS